MAPQVLGQTRYPLWMNPNGYPFLSRRQIAERIHSDPAFAVECVAILQERHERRGSAGGVESMGWMASQAAKAVKLAAKLASGEATEKDRAEAMQLASRYTKQLARVFRERELANRPELGAQAAVFGVGVGGKGEQLEPAETLTEPTVETAGAPRAEETLARQKKRGRPKGSKNKQKKEIPRRRPARD
jgi:hypothetical protein